MNNENDHRLDDLLSQWDDAKSRSTEDLDGLRHEITSRLASEDLSELSAPPRRSGSWKSLAIAACGIAAAVAITVSIRSLLPTSSDDSMARTVSPSHFAAISASELSEKRQLLDEVQRLFDSQLAGVVETDNDVRIDVQDTNSMDSPFLAIRIAMVTRRTDDEPWKLAWKMDALSRDQRVLRVQPTAQPSDSVSVWAYMMPDGTFAVDLDASLPSGGRLQSRGSCVIQSGQPTPVLFAQHDGTQYCVYQTVTRLGPDAS